MIATLLDSAAGCAVQSLLPAGVGYTSLDLTVKFVHAITVESGAPGRCAGTGAVTHLGGRTALAQAELRGPERPALRTAVSSLLVLRPESDPEPATSPSAVTAWSAARAVGTVTRGVQIVEVTGCAQRRLVVRLAARCGRATLSARFFRPVLRPADLRLVGLLLGPAEGRAFLAMDDGRPSACSTWRRPRRPRRPGRRGGVRAAGGRPLAARPGSAGRCSSTPWPTRGGAGRIVHATRQSGATPRCSTCCTRLPPERAPGGLRAGGAALRAAPRDRVAARGSTEPAGRAT